MGDKTLMLFSSGAGAASFAEDGEGEVDVSRWVSTLSRSASLVSGVVPFFLSSSSLSEVRSTGARVGGPGLMEEPLVLMGSEADVEGTGLRSGERAGTLGGPAVFGRRVAD